MILTIYSAYALLHSWYECSECGSVISTLTRELDLCPVCHWITISTEDKIWTKDQMKIDMSTKRFVEELKRVSPDWRQAKELFNGIEFTFTIHTGGNG